MLADLSSLASRASLLLLALLLALGACNSSGALGDDDDEEITPPDDDDDDAAADDDDDDDDDDDASGPSSLSFDPNEVSAGDLLWVSATWENFDLTQTTSICCATEGIVTFQSGQVSGSSVPVLMFFGLHTEGELEWGLDNGQGDEVVGTFTASAIGEIPTITPGIETVSAGIEEEGGFNVFQFEVAEPFTIVTARANNIAPEDFHPWMLALADDGYTVLAAHGFHNDEQQQEPFVSFVAPEPGTYYLRVQDNAQAGGPTFDYDLDLGFTESGAPTEVAEVEPNDDTEDFQALGLLSPGGYSLAGTAETAGHADNNDLNGDLDVFTFSVDQQVLANFSLNWDTSDDFDAVVYDNSSGDIELGFGSDDAISLDMASTAQPEIASVELEPGDYAIQIGNWDGDPNSEWQLDMWLLPSTVAP